VVDRPRLLQRWRLGVATWAHNIIGSRESPSPLDLAAACDAVFGRIARSGSWEDLRHCTTELRFLCRHFDRLIEATRLHEGASPEVCVASAALARVRQDLVEVMPIPWYPPGFCRHHARLRDTLYDAVSHLRYGLLVLSWARAAAPRPRTRVS
jgi:hypothetical protein